MKITILFLAIIVSSCCSKPAPEKIASVSFRLKSNKDSLFLKNIKRIYAIGSVKNTFSPPRNNQTFDYRNFYYESQLPVSYAFDSTIYVFENNIKVNDTLIVHYKRNISYGEGDNCGYQQILSFSPKPHYSTLKKYQIDVVFGTYGTLSGYVSIRENAYKIVLIEK